MKTRPTRSLAAVVGVASVLLLLAAEYRAAAPVSALRQQIATSLPLGSTRQQVETYLQVHAMMDVAAFDYPAGDPRQGRHLLTRAHQWLPPHDAHLLFWFDRTGDQGRLVSVEVSEKPIRMPPP